MTSRYWLVSGLVSVFVSKVNRWHGAWRWQTWGFATQHARFCALPLVALLLRLPSSAFFVQLCFSRFLSTYFLRVVFHAFGYDLGFFLVPSCCCCHCFSSHHGFRKDQGGESYRRDGRYVHFPALFFVALQLSLYQRVRRIMVLCRGIFLAFPIAQKMNEAWRLALEMHGRSIYCWRKLFICLFCVEKL